MRYWALALTLFALPIPASAEDFNNDAIILLSQTGIGDEVILSKIASLPCAYNVSTSDLLKLKGAGVSSPVIAAMVDRCTGSSSAQGSVAQNSDPSMMREAGLYIDQGSQTSHNLQKIRPTVASGGRMTGNGSILFPFRLKLGIPQVTAQTTAPTSSPTFYFYFETDNRDVGNFGTSATVAAQSPSEFSLVRFKVNKGQREFVVGKANPFNANLGVNPDDAIQFSVEELRDGIFAVKPLQPVQPGQYAFVLRAGSDAYRIYDFTVGAPQ